MKPIVNGHKKYSIKYVTHLYRCVTYFIEYLHNAHENKHIQEQQQQIFTCELVSE